MVQKDLVVIHKNDFSAKNLISNTGLFLLFESAKDNGIFELIDNDLVFDNEATNKIKMNPIKTMLWGHFIVELTNWNGSNFYKGIHQSASLIFQ